MEISEALGIIKVVADGINPFTGEAFPSDSVYQHPQMVRAMYRAVTVLEARQKWEDKKKQMPENAGKQWTDEDDRQLLGGFDNGVKIPDLARKFKRTIASIEARLEMHGKIEPQERDRDRFRRT